MAFFFFHIRSLWKTQHCVLYVYFFIKSVVKWSENSVRFEFFMGLPDRPNSGRFYLTVWDMACMLQIRMLIGGPHAGRDKRIGGPYAGRDKSSYKKLSIGVESLRCTVNSSYFCNDTCTTFTRTCDMGHSSSHQILRGKPSHTIFCILSRSNCQIMKGIPITDGLREEWVHVSSRSEGLKSQWVMISTAPQCSSRTPSLYHTIFVNTCGQP